MKTAFVVFCSPAGSTGHVAQVIADSLKEKAVTTHLLDLGAGQDPSPFIGLLKTADADDCLFVGSPVYREMAVPPVMAFLGDLPPASGAAAVPFVTWGGAISGIALWQMGQVLQNKGYILTGGAKVLAVHSTMWQSEHPVGQGHPNNDDDQQVRHLVINVFERLSTSTTNPMPLSQLDYQPQAISADFKKKMDQPWMIIPKTIDDDRCTQCGTCEAVCPVGAVALDPGPVFNARCFDCFKCVRECPEDAINSSVPLGKIESMIRGRVEKYNEMPHTQIFF
jgi:ferredoxin/flavodoxin